MYLDPGRGLPDARTRQEADEKPSAVSLEEGPALGRQQLVAGITATPFADARFNEHQAKLAKPHANQGRPSMKGRTER
jgi:hypothetical protein